MGWVDSGWAWRCRLGLTGRPEAPWLTVWLISGPVWSGWHGRGARQHCDVSYHASCDELPTKSCFPSDQMTLESCEAPKLYAVLSACALEIDAPTKIPASCARLISTPDSSVTWQPHLCTGAASLCCCVMLVPCASRTSTRNKHTFQALLQCPVVKTGYAPSTHHEGNWSVPRHVRNSHQCCQNTCTQIHPWSFRPPPAMRLLAPNHPQIIILIL